jgi:hypothetical protein
VNLPQRLLAIHGALDTARLPHAFGGAIALAYWTESPRGTSDIDVNIFVAAERAGPALTALPGGVDVPEGTADVIAETGQVRLWWAGTPIDLFFDYEPIHADAAAHRVTVPFEGEQIPVLGPTELAVFKAMFDRTRDWADLEDMVAAGSLDVAAVTTSLARLVDADDHRFAKLEALA